MKSNEKLLLWEIAVYATYAGLNLSFIIPFALILGANNISIGIIAALPYFGLLIGQIPGEKILEKIENRKEIIVFFMAIARFHWFLIAIIAFYVKSVKLFIIILISYYILVYLKYPSWMSLLGEAINLKNRGKFFSKRLEIYYGIYAMISIIAGIVLDHLGNNLMSGFGVLFLIGTGFGLIGPTIIKKLKIKKRSYLNHNIKEYFKFNYNLKWFISYSLIFNFGWFLASPFFSVYMLENLAMNYSQYVIYNAVFTLTIIISQMFWGWFSDSFGSKICLIISSIMMSLVPLLMILVDKNNLYFIIPIHIISGLGFGGFSLTSLSLLLNITHKKDRNFDSAKYALVSSLPLIISPIIGGFLIDNINFVLSGIPLVFVIASVFRLVAIIPLLKVKEKTNLTYSNLIEKLASNFIHKEKLNENKVSLK